MVGAILTNESPVTLDHVTPIARLTGEYEAIVVPAASDIKDMADLVEKLKADPGAVSWGGGSAGGTDHITAGPDRQGGRRRSDQGQLHRLLRRRRGAGRDPRRPGDGRHLRLRRVRSRRSRPATLRLIGISSDERVAGIDAPTFKEGGVDVSIQNWRMVAAAPGLTDEQKAAVSPTSRRW